MKTIKVVKLLESPCLLAPEKGELLFEKIKNELKKSEKIILDFSEYQFISSTFLNRAFGQLCIDLCLSIKDFRNKIEIRNLDEDDLDEVELTLHNAQMKRKLIDKNIDFKKLSESMLPA